jgi:protein-S-isoprenylcysteine O-methyltransferase Ste14
VNALRGLLAPLPLFGVMAALLLLSAGKFGGVWVWPRAWTYLAVTGLASAIASALLVVYRPASFQVRQQAFVASREKRQPLIDALGLLFYAGCLAAWLAFIPIDVFRLKLLPSPGAGIVAAGAAMALAGLAISYLAIAQNRYAAPTIHDQAGQRLVDTGLYGVVRHPFYAGMLLVYAGTALWLGSYAAAIASTAFLIMTLARILIEEAHLRKALPDYGAYARRVRRRLIPFLL